MNPTWRGVPSALSEARGGAEAGVDDALDLGDVELEAVEEELRGGGGGRPGRPLGGGRWRRADLAGSDETVLFYVNFKSFPLLGVILSPRAVEGARWQDCLADLARTKDLGG